MKFGKRILQIAAAHQDFQGYYLDYKSLKKLLKLIRNLARDGNPQDCSAETLQCWAGGESSDVADAEERFMLSLEGEFAKVESFFRSKVAEFMAAFKCLCKRFAGVRMTAPLQGAPRSFHDFGARLSGHPEDEELIQELLEFVDEVDALRGFVMTNAQAVVKICKKHDKRSPIPIRGHFMRVLARCTFYNSREFGGMIADTHVLLSEVYRQFIGLEPPEESASFACQICNHVLCNPLELECKHLFCNCCVSLSTFFAQHRCPVCFQVCELTEEHMRVHTLRSHHERLIDDIAFSSVSRAASGFPDHAPRTMGRLKDCITAAPGLRRTKSDLGTSISSSSSADQWGRRHRSKSDLQLAAKVQVPCSLEAPCEKCVQRSPHVKLLRLGPSVSPLLMQACNVHAVVAYTFVPARAFV
jgi:hypothetical protein